MGVTVAPPGVENAPKPPVVATAPVVDGVPNGLALGAVPAVADPNVKLVEGADTAGWPKAEPAVLVLNLLIDTKVKNIIVLNLQCSNSSRLFCS